MPLRGFERRLERMVEGTFARIFRTGVAPVEIGRRISREMDAQRAPGVSGQVVVPNHFVVRLGQSDHEQYSQIAGTLSSELAVAANEHADDERYGFMGPVEVDLVLDEAQTTGQFEVTASFREASGGATPATVVYGSGERVALEKQIATVGRSSDSTITFVDSNVSRHHAELRPTPNGWVVIDLGSTNGTKVNGTKVTERLLSRGDEITFGSSTVTFV